MHFDRKIGRRKTLGILGAAATGLALGRPLTARAAEQAAGANERIRLGMIGNGGMGTRHIEALSVNSFEIGGRVRLLQAALQNAFGVVQKLPATSPRLPGLPHLHDRHDIDAI